MPYPVNEAKAVPQYDDEGASLYNSLLTNADEALNKINFEWWINRGVDRIQAAAIDDDRKFIRMVGILHSITRAYLSEFALPKMEEAIAKEEEIIRLRFAERIEAAKREKTIEGKIARVNEFLINNKEMLLDYKLDLAEKKFEIILVAIKHRIPEETEVEM